MFFHCASPRSTHNHLVSSQRAFDEYARLHPPPVQDAYKKYMKVVEYISQVLQMDSSEKGEFAWVCECGCE